MIRSWLLLAALLSSMIGRFAAAEISPPAPRGLRRQNCLGTPDDRFIISQALLGRFTPRMLGTVLEVSYCRPLVRRAELLYFLSNVTTGGIFYISPILNAYGGYVSVTPLSFLTMRLDVLYWHHWSLPRPTSSGFFKLPSYDASFRDSDLMKRQGGTASAFIVQSRTTLRGRIDLGRWTRLALVDNFWVDYWWIDQNTFYKNIPRDVVLAKSDWVVVNDVTLLFEMILRQQNPISLFLAVQHEWTYVPNHPYHAHLLTGFVIVRIARLGKVVRNLRAFVQAGSHLQHAFRVGRLYIGGGFLVDYDLGPVSHAR
ncbi:MAG: hypothetical protein KC609_05160 [Myxococcales bacterium]|nr:hypothetical protein [Myxococcales bacterium]